MNFVALALIKPRLVLHGFCGKRKPLGMKILPQAPNCAYRRCSAVRRLSGGASARQGGETANDDGKKADDHQEIRKPASL
jgi:hypothetical protein